MPLTKYLDKKLLNVCDWENQLDEEREKTGGRRGDDQN